MHSHFDDVATATLTIYHLPLTCASYLLLGPKTETHTTKKRIKDQDQDD